MLKRSITVLLFVLTPSFGAAASADTPDMGAFVAARIASLNRVTPEDAVADAIRQDSFGLYAVNRAGEMSYPALICRAPANDVTARPARILNLRATTDDGPWAPYHAAWMRYAEAYNRAILQSDANPYREWCDYATPDD